MSTTLQLFSRNVDSATLRRAVPPQVWPGRVDPLHWNGDAFSCDLPPSALNDAREILPCLSLVDAGEWGYQFALEYETKAGNIGRTALDPIGAFDGAESGLENEAVEAAIDVLHLREPLQSARLHLRVQSFDLDVPALLSISVRDGKEVSAPSPGGSRVELAVPPRSQMVLRPELTSHVCSPTSIAMLLDYYDRSADIYEVIEAARHQPSGRHGVWPANIRVAARRGLLGYLLHFPSWQAARALLAAGLPIVASVRYEEGELGDAAIRRTSGHLLVVRGCEGSKVLVNDPAAASDAEVLRAYDLEEFCRIWLERSAVGYVLLGLDSR
jgi:hypothetical protein